MALFYQVNRAVTTLAVLFSIGVTCAEEILSTGNNEGETVMPRPTHTVVPNISEKNISFDNSTEHSTPSSNQQANLSTEPSNNDTDTVTENPLVQQISSKVTTQKNVTDTTQLSNQDKDTTQNPSESSDGRIPQANVNNTQDRNNQSKPASAETVTPETEQDNKKQSNIRSDSTTQFVPVTFDTRWMDTFIHTHHFEGQYMFSDVRYLFDFVIRYKHPNDPKTLVTNFYDADGAVLEFNGTSTDGCLIVFTLSKIYTPGVRFPLNEPLEVTGSFERTDQPYFTGNFTKPINSSFSWFHMNKGLGAIETGETAGTKTAIVIIIPTSIAFLGICGTVAIICWASKKGYLRGRHKSYRLFTDAQVSYESEAETIHI